MMSNQAVAVEQDFRLIQRLFLVPGKRNSVLTFTPVEHGSGASWIINRTARVLANHFRRHKVCVVDANFRSPMQHRNYLLENKNGFAQVLSESVDIRSAIQQIAGSNLYVITAGQASGEPYRLLLSDVLQAKLDELRKQFDHVLIDTPAAAEYSDATLIGRWTDGMVLVVAAEDTKQETAIRVRDDMQAAEVPLIGAILNKREFPIPESLYQRL